MFVTVDAAFATTPLEITPGMVLKRSTTLRPFSARSRLEAKGFRLVVFRFDSQSE
jgi:hypothetical protein